MTDQAEPKTGENTPPVNPPKRTFATWVGVGMLIGMGTLCGAMGAGGIYLAVTMASTKPAAAFGGLLMAGATGYIMPYMTMGINELLNPGSTARAQAEKPQKNDKPNTGLSFFKKGPAR